MRAFELVPMNGTAFLSMHADGPPSKWVDKESLISQCLMAAVILTMLNFLLCRLTEYKDGLPVVGRSFLLEPSLITRIRFAFNSRQILNAAYKKFNGRAYRVVRGDTDFVVLPAESVKELNRLPQTVLNSRQCHSFSLVGRLNDMQVVVHTDFHVRVLLSTISPSLPQLLGPASSRMEETMRVSFPQDTDNWTQVNMMDSSAAVAGRTIALAVVGAPLCDNLEFMKVTNEHTKDVFTITFVMRLFPECLQSTLVWLLPSKWRFFWGHKKIEKFINIESERQKTEPVNLATAGGSPLPTLLHQMKQSKQEKALDTSLLTKLLAALSAGGTYSVANFIFAFLIDMAANPEALEEIRQEIRDKHREIDGSWDFEAFNDLPKMDSAFKETMRLAPGSLTTYSRVVQKDYTLSSGLVLRKGQFVCIDSSSRALDDEVYPDAHKYDAMRAYNENLEDHLSQPFKGVYGTDFRWGAGRWACSGRLLASLLLKWMAVKLLDEYDFRVPEGVRTAHCSFHEYLFVPPWTQMQMRRRKENLGIHCI